MADEWYSKALEVLGPLRWHLNELIEVMEFHNRYAKKVGAPILSEAKIAAAKKAQDKANEFFSLTDSVPAQPSSPLVVVLSPVPIIQQNPPDIPASFISVRNAGRIGG